MPSAYNNNNNSNTDFSTCRCLHLIRRHHPLLPTRPHPHTPFPLPLTLHFEVHGLWVLPDRVAGRAHVLSGVCVLDFFESQGRYPRVAAHHDAPIQGLAGKELRVRGWAPGSTAAQGQNKHKSTSQQPPSAQHLEAITWQVKPWAQHYSGSALLRSTEYSDSKHSGNGNKKKRNEGPKYRMLLHNWGQLDNIKLLLRLTTAEIQLWLKHFCQDAFAENLHSKYCFHTENLRLTLLSLILVLFLHPWSGISKNRSKPQSWIRQNESSELSLEHSTKQSKVQRTGQANYGTLLKTACFKVLWCSKKILEQTLLIVSQFRNCSHKQESAGTPMRERDKE